MTAESEKIEELATGIICPTCLAGRGAQCRSTATGHVCAMHQPRKHPIIATLRYEQGKAPQ